MKQKTSAENLEHPHHELFILGSLLVALVISAIAIYMYTEAPTPPIIYTNPQMISSMHYEVEGTTTPPSIPGQAGRQ